MFFLLCVGGCVVGRYFRGLLSDGTAKAAVTAFVQQSSRLRCAADARAREMAAQLAAAPAASAAAQDTSEEGTKGGDEEDQGDEDDEAALGPRAVFSLPAFYRTLVTVAGHYDACGGLVVGTVAAPPTPLLPTSAATSPPAPSDVATWGGVGPRFAANNMAGSVRRRTHAPALPPSRSCARARLGPS